MRTGSVRFPLMILMMTALAACGKEQPQAGAGGAPEAGFITVKAEPFTLVTELPGRTTAHQIAEVRPQVNGIIEERLFKEGEEVKAGEALYKIDDSLYKSDLESAKANLASAQATLKSVKLRAERFGKLIKSNAVSQQEVDEAQAAYGESRAQVQAAQAAVDTARINLGYTTIKAPINGRIGRSAVTAGALVTANQSVALSTIRELDPIYVDLTQSFSTLRELRSAMEAGKLQKLGDDKARVTLVMEDGTEYKQPGSLQFSEYSVDETTGSVTLRALFPNPDGDLLPGQFVRARLPQGERQNAILVPQKGITREPSGDASALVIGADNKVEKRQVTTERTVGNQWLVSDGLNAGDKLIVDGLQKLAPGAQVKPVQMDEEKVTAPKGEPKDAEGEDVAPEDAQQNGNGQSQQGAQSGAGNGAA
ncbi:efflux RND transporter periplasmic adaptor subunit [Alloalcanivorax mobilis]|uniref:efflux RND transporter periplasmic adaptor subunit n=1 Tax=Alloalcanivorax mobilis TaxID=2019569 RepID=UPI000C759769|nr:efflux RND transporter periplasmic adaptor subunit [Alloalcanivorax mobilis]